MGNGAVLPAHFPGMDICAEDRNEGPTNRVRKAIQDELYDWSKCQSQASQIRHVEILRQRNQKKRK
jgi:hypothetical protein